MAVAGLGAAAIAADVLWSDPVADPGLELNEQRGVGTVFGPDITEVGYGLSCNCCQVCASAKLKQTPAVVQVTLCRALCR